MAKGTMWSRVPVPGPSLPMRPRMVSMQEVALMNIRPLSTEPIKYLYLGDPSVLPSIISRFMFLVWQRTTGCFYHLYSQSIMDIQWARLAQTSTAGSLLRIRYNLTPHLLRAIIPLRTRCLPPSVHLPRRLSCLPLLVCFAPLVPQ